jgi:hypothetical protein
MTTQETPIPRWVAGTGVVGTVFIGCLAFWLSFTALTKLAALSGVADPWAWPLIVDGMVVVATVAVVAMSGRRGAWYPWTLLVGGAATSVFANAFQATVMDGIEVPPTVASAVAAAPPVVLLAMTHLTVVLGRSVRSRLPRTGTLTPDDKTPIGATPHALPPSDPKAFLVDLLLSEGGEASAADAIAAGRRAGFTKDQIMNARRRSTNPAIASVKDAMRGGWTWRIMRPDLEDVS